MAKTDAPAPKKQAAVKESSSPVGQASRVPSPQNRSKAQKKSLGKKVLSSLEALNAKIEEIEKKIVLKLERLEALLEKLSGKGLKARDEL